ncbi:MAG TPA: hypothetical protein VLK35_06985 [Methylomirabilota bacterium]|nr:hypothetical protein [Methylomirabilota bacterium]
MSDVASVTALIERISGIPGHPTNPLTAAAAAHEEERRTGQIIECMGGTATGFLHITRLRGDPVNAEYQIVFAPLGGRLRGRHARCQGLDVLTTFLQRAGVPLPEIERAWQNLAKRRIHSVSRVALTPAQLEALGL